MLWVAKETQAQARIRSLRFHMGKSVGLYSLQQSLKLDQTAPRARKKYNSLREIRKKPTQRFQSPRCSHGLNGRRSPAQQNEQGSQSHYGAPVLRASPNLNAKTTRQPCELMLVTMSRQRIGCGSEAAL